MAPVISSWDDLAFNHEETDDNTGQHKQTIFAVVDDDDVAYFGTSSLPKKDLSVDLVTSLLTPIPDEDIYPQWTTDGNNFTEAQDTNTFLSALYIKRPILALYAVFKEHNVLRLIPKALQD